MNPSPYGPGPGGPGGPGGSPPVLPPGRPWMPPPRRRRVNPIVPFLVLGVVAAAVIGGIYYATDYRPREYLKDWAARISPPQGRFQGGDEGGDNHQRYVIFSEKCDVTNPCDPPPVDAVTDWIKDNGGSADKTTVAQCFKYGGGINLTDGDHASSIRCDQYSPSRQIFSFTITLAY